MKTQTFKGQIDETWTEVDLTQFKKENPKFVNCSHKTFVFIIQTAWLTDVDYATEAYNIEDAYKNAEKEWPPKNGHRIFFNYKY